MDFYSKNKRLITKIKRDLVCVIEIVTMEWKSTDNTGAVFGNEVTLDGNLSRNEGKKKFQIARKKENELIFAVYRAKLGELFAV